MGRNKHWSYLGLRPSGNHVPISSQVTATPINPSQVNTPPSSSSSVASADDLDTSVDRSTRTAYQTPSSANRRSSWTSATGRKIHNYTLGECLGKGAFGSVYRALNWQTGETVAAKQISLENLSKLEIKKIMLEIDLLRTLDHPNIVRYHGFVKDQNSLFIILEYCENGSLTAICKSFGRFPEHLVSLYIAQVLQGLVYLHDRGVVHRDIKGANILTTKEGIVKLADFGVATTAMRDSQVVGTPNWMAPEIIQLQGAHETSDIWSVGCTIIELIIGKPPYYELQQMQALYRIVDDPHPPLPDNLSPLLKDFLLKCFDKDPSKRMSARELLRHPWIQKTDLNYEDALHSVETYNSALKRRSTQQNYSGGVEILGPAHLSSKLNGAHQERHKVTSIEDKLCLYAETTTTQKSITDSPDDNWDSDFGDVPNHLIPKQRQQQQTQQAPNMSQVGYHQNPPMFPLPTVIQQLTTGGRRASRPPHSSSTRYLSKLTEDESDGNDWDKDFEGELVVDVLR